MLIGLIGVIISYCICTWKREAVYLKYMIFSCQLDLIKVV